MTRILVIEDSDLAVALRANLEVEGHDVDVAGTARRALELLGAFPVDLVILDLMLPDKDGLHVLRTLRQQGEAMPVLVLTARGQESEKVVALQLGADDYVTKPFGLLELLARVNALLRRSRAQAGPSAIYRLGELEVDEARRAVRRRGLPVDLTPKEFDLLLELLRAGGSVVSRSELLRRVWGYRSAVATRTLDTHVAELRRKLKPSAKTPPIIVTARKVGYRVAMSAEPSSETKVR